MTGEAAGLAMGLCELGGKSVNDIGDTKAPSSREPDGSTGCVSITVTSWPVAKCREHYLDTLHFRLSRTKEEETTLYHLPRPNRHHLDCLWRGSRGCPPVT